MRLVRAFAVAVAVALVLPAVHGVAFQGDPDRVVPGGGVFVPGWKGKVPDASSLSQGRKIEDSKFAVEGDKWVLNSGPGGIYWNPANTGSGDYTVKATFEEPHVRSSSSHAHPYGIFIAGNGLDGDQYSLLYCLAYGERNRFIVRGFGPAPFQMNGRSGETNPAVDASTTQGGAVKQDIAMSVKGDRVECSINGTMVAGYTKAEVVGDGKLKSTDGIAGIRISHNADIVITGFSVQK